MSPLKRGIKRETDISLEVGPSRLYLDDLQAIYDELSKFQDQSYSDAPEAHKKLQGRIRIDVGDAEAAAISDIEEATPEDLRNVRLIGSFRQGLFVISLGPRSGAIRATANDPEVRALVNDIAAHIEKRREWAYTFPTYKHFTFVGLLGLLYFIFTASSLTLGSIEAESAVSSLITAVALSFFLVLPPRLARMNGSVLVIGKWRKDAYKARGESKKMALIAIVGLVGAILGSIISGVFGFWEGLFMK